MIYEVLPVIAAYGTNVEVDPDVILESGQMLCDVETSMLQDLERRNQLELAFFCDAVIELARMKDIAMPVTEAIRNLAHFKRDQDMEAFAA
jgi:2-dehydropantoate 2-reductase